MNEQAIYAILKDANQRAPETVLRLFASEFVLFAKSAANIKKFGAIVQHPKTGAPMDNPYLAVRDKSQARLAKMAGLESAKVWELYNDFLENVKEG